MKRRKPLTPAAINAALAAQSLRLSECWLVYWPNRPPTVARYQTPVTLARVLSEHRAAVAAEPLETTQCVN